MGFRDRKGFPDDYDRELQKKAQGALVLAEDLIDWISEFGPTRTGKSSQISVADESHLVALWQQAAALFRATLIPPAVAICGPSQSGKGIFVGQILEPLDTDFSPLGQNERLGHPAYVSKLSFAADIKPMAGASETTGVITRFTIADRFEPNALVSYPVMARPLSRLGCLLSLARGFRSECSLPRDEVWQDTQLYALFEEVAENGTGRERDRCWTIDLLEVYSKLKSLDPTCFLADKSTFNRLLSRYPLSEEGYVELAARLCWNGWPGLTALFERIRAFSEKVKQSGRDGFLCHWYAVRFLLSGQQSQEYRSPSSNCLEHVTWNDLVDKEVDGWYVLDYQPGQGPPQVDLASIQSAVGEIVIPVIPERMQPAWSQVLQQMDVLDIPGIRAAGGAGLGFKEDDSSSADAQQYILRRGKIFNLFDQYLEESKILALLMLIRGGNVEIRGLLYEIVNKWGRARYGMDWPYKFRDDTPGLFLCLTGIDDEIGDRPTNKALYDARLDSLVTEVFKEIMTDFGDIDRPFTNIFPVRFPGTWDADQQRRQAKGLEKWEKAEQAFLESKLVQTYVANAEEKWAAAMTDGDGGMSMIADGLQRCASKLRKQDGFSGRAQDIRMELIRLAKSWFVDKNIASDRTPGASIDANFDKERRIEVANKVVRWLTQDEKRVDLRFDALQRSLRIQPEDLLELFSVAEARWSTATFEPETVFERLYPALNATLLDWGNQWAPDRWKEYIESHDEGAPWLEMDDFAAFTRYLVDYLLSGEVFQELGNRLLSVITLTVCDEQMRHEARRRYTRMILNDFVLNPGPSSKLIQGWASWLPQCLAAGAAVEAVGGFGAVTVFPPGNRELIGLLDSFGIDVAESANQVASGNVG